MTIYAIREYVLYEINNLIDFYFKEEDADAECKRLGKEDAHTEYSVETVEVG